MKYETWTKFGEKLHSLALWVVKGISLPLMVFLFVAGLIFSYQIIDTGAVFVKNYDPVVLHVLGILGILLVLCLLMKLPDKGIFVLKYVVLAAVFFRYIDLGKELIELGESGPTADQYIVYRLAELFSMNDFTAIQPTGGTYLSFYPHQLGIISVYEIIFRICARVGVEEPVYEVIKNINIYGACAMVFVQSKIVRELSKSVKAELVYLILMFFNLPLIFYTSYVYGEILSMLCFCAGLLLLIRYDNERRKKSRLVFSLLLFVISIIFRKNALILCIAVACVLFVKGWWQKRKEYFVYLVLMLFTVTNILFLVRAVYEYRAGNTLLDGVPAIAYVAMGMQESMTGNGFYNGYNYNTLEACNMDRELMTEVCKQDIKERMQYFAENKKEAVLFYLEKIMCQWTDGTYFCRQAIASVFLLRQDILEEICEGKEARKFETICNGYQTLLYLGCVLFLIKERKSNSLMIFICFIAAIGGFLFHFVWEANSRYIMPYNMLLMMNASIGLMWLAERVSTIRKSK